MTRSRLNRLATVLYALVSLLFMQLAIAGYSCPSDHTTPGKVTEGAAMMQAGMPCAGSMALAPDNEQPGLCHAHCQADPQTADKYQVPGLATLTDLATDFPLPRITPAPLGVLLQAPLLRRTTAPPLAVRNCCFRI